MNWKCLSLNEGYRVKTVVYGYPLLMICIQVKNTPVYEERLNGIGKFLKTDLGKKLYCFFLISLKISEKEIKKREAFLFLFDTL